MFGVNWGPSDAFQLFHPVQPEGSAVYSIRHLRNSFVKLVCEVSWIYWIFHPQKFSLSDTKCDNVDMWGSEVLELIHYSLNK